MTPYVADVPEVAQQLAHDGLGSSAVRALEVAVLDHGHRRVERATYVVRLGVDRKFEIEKRLGAAEQGRDTAPLRQQSDGAEHQPGEGGRAHGGGEDARLGLLELCAAECERGDEQRDGEADAGARAGAGDGAPADRRPQPPARQPRDYQGHADDAERLAGHVADKHAERDRRARGPLEEVAVDRDASIGEREQRDDHVARPPVVHEL